MRHLRESIAQGRLPQALILAGPRGAGKYTLALMLAQAVNCLKPTESDGLPDFCGVLPQLHCALATRPSWKSAWPRRSRHAMKCAMWTRRDTRILIQTHPDVLIVPPDPPQLLIKLGQVRHGNSRGLSTARPSRRSGHLRFLRASAFMKEAANSLLKVLEEPPEHTSLILLTENPQELLPTIRSRAVLHRLGALPAAELEALLGMRRPELKAAGACAGGPTGGGRCGPGA